MILDRYLPKNKWIRAVLFLLFDICMTGVCAFFSLWVRFDMSVASVPKQYAEAARLFLPYISVSCIMTFFAYKMYSTMWGGAGVREMFQVFSACLTAAVVQLAISQLLSVRLPRSFYLLWFVFMTVFVGGSRISYRAVKACLCHMNSRKRYPRRKRVMIVGGGQAGTLLIKELKSSDKSKAEPVCIIDDDRAKIGKYINGVPIKGNSRDIPQVADSMAIDEIYIAMPAASVADRKRVLEACQKTGIQMKILPGIYQLANGDVSVTRLRNVRIEDLLGREPVQVSLDEIMDYVQGKVVLVTGGGGSIGSELCRQIASHQPKQLIIVDIYENNAYEIQQELIRKYPQLNLVVLIASVRNTERIDAIFEKYRPNIVYHAAAHKHVPLMEVSPNEAIKNNVFGTYRTAQAADKYGVEKFVLISTDKAVNPTNVMGASKRMCEMVIQMMNRQSKTNFVAVRFGNVLGSNGSVIPLFKKQIAAGGPVTVTDKNIIRYFMTIPEAVSLVLQAGSYAKGGEIFVLDMGEPVRIDDMARNLIKLSGYEPDVDIPIVYTGLRPGEKLFEECLREEEGLQKTPNNLIFIGKPIPFDENEFFEKLVDLKKTAYEDDPEMKMVVKDLIPSYRYKE